MPVTPVASNVTEYSATFTIDGLEFRVTAVHPMGVDEGTADGAAQKLVNLLDASPDVALSYSAAFKTRSETLSVSPS